MWHDGLIFKLKQNGIECPTLTLLLSYLSNRKQRVALNGFNSEWAPIESGVPQGSVIGPLLFLIYINDLETNIKSSVKFFADDTMLYSIVSDPSISAEELNHDLNLISNWALQWKMSFNPDPNKQAVEIIFTQKREKAIHPPLLSNGSIVKAVTHHKHLGFLDSKLTCPYHFDEKIATAKKGIGVIKFLSKYCPIKTPLKYT